LWLAHGTAKIFVCAGGWSQQNQKRRPDSRKNGKKARRGIEKAGRELKPRKRKRKSQNFPGADSKKANKKKRCNRWRWLKQRGGLGKRPGPIAIHAKQRIRAYSEEAISVQEKGPQVNSPADSNGGDKISQPVSDSKSHEWLKNKTFNQGSKRGGKKGR